MTSHILCYSRLFALACICWATATCAAAPAPSPTSSPTIVAYVFPRENPIPSGGIAAQKLTRINFAFSNIENGRIVNGTSYDDQNLAFLVALKQQNPSLTVLTSVGGWLWSGAFSDMALTPQSRAIFIQSVADYVTKHQLDGLDVDWEFPGMQGVTNHFRPEDKQNYTSLLRELRSRFNKLEKELGRPLYLSVATGAGSDWLVHTELNKVAKYVDTVNLMAYDYYEPDVDATTGNHAPLFTDPADPKKVSDDSSIALYEKAGVHAGKIVLGVPFYAHVWGQVPAANHGLFQPGKEIPRGNGGFGDGPDAMLKNGFVRYWDSASQVPFLYNAGKQMFASYEDPESLAPKCKYVLSHKLRGIMFWDYESDQSGALLDAVNDGLHKTGDGNQ
jgi:chitinase